MLAPCDRVPTRADSTCLGRSSALRIVSRTDATVVLPTYAKPTTSRPSPPTSPKPRPVAAKDATPPEKPRLTSEDVKRVAEEALEQVWGLGSDKPEPGGEPVLEPPAKQIGRAHV